MKVALKKIIYFENSDKVFRDVLTPPAILYFEKEEHNTVDFSTLRIENNELSESNLRTYSFNSLNPNDKWKNYFLIKGDSFKKLTNFENYARTKRGIATGANDFFLLTEEERLVHNINLRYVRKCITKSTYVNKMTFSSSDFELLKSMNKKVWLLYLNDYKPNSDKHIENYIQSGASLKISEKHLPKNRKVWYHMENGNTADLWIGTFSRNGIKFVVNEAQISNLTCFHSIIIKKQYKKYLYFFMGYFLSTIAKNVLCLNTREHGNGLLKLEPNDINNSFLPRLDDFSSEEIHEVMNITVDIVKGDNKKKLDKLNSIFNEKLLDLDKSKSSSSFSSLQNQFLF